MPQQPWGTLRTEGLAMMTALVKDFSEIPNVEVVSTLDDRLTSVIPSLFELDNVYLETISVSSHLSTFERLCHTSDCVLVIAPESCGILEQMTRAAADRGARLLSPDLETVSLFGNKQKTAAWLESHNIPTTIGTEGNSLADFQDLKDEFSFPAVLKPVDGAGSMDLRMVRTLDELQQLKWRDHGSYRLESFVPGIPASVSVLLGNSSHHPIILHPCQQLLRSDTLEYQGGRLLPHGEFCRRAMALADRVASEIAKRLPDSRGYLGIDMVLGDGSEGSVDRVIEINPRMTTSYVGLRAATNQNLANAILSPQGNFDLRFSRLSLEFRSDGTILDSQPSDTLCDG